jgi:hypothetical protein
VDNEQWLQHLLDMSRLALAERRDGPKADEDLAAALEEFSAHLEQRLRGGRRDSDD